MTGRQVAGAGILAAVFLGFFVAYGILAGWTFAIAGFGGGILLSIVVIYAVRLLVSG